MCHISDRPVIESPKFDVSSSHTGDKALMDDDEASCIHKIDAKNKIVSCPLRKPGYDLNDHLVDL